MDTDAHESDLTEAVIGSAFEVANVLGAGFLEKVYERALVRELASHGRSAKAQVSFPVWYKGHYVGEYVAGFEFVCIRVHPWLILSLRSLWN